MQAYKYEGKIGVGSRIGRLTVREATQQRRGGCVVWRCECDCGGSVFLDTRQLRRQEFLDCGCGRKHRNTWRNLSGKRFGKLVCLEEMPDRSARGTVWRCKCDCGNECLALGIQLTSGYKKSCGCLRGPKVEEFQGKRFGALVVTSYAGKRGGKHLWNCRCDCGAETVVSQTNLRSGHTKSCGCLQREIYRKNLKLIDGTSVTMIENRMKRPIKSNTSGVSGVYYSRRIDAWCAQITFKGKTYSLGSFEDKQEAIQARKRGEEMYDDFLEWYYGRNRGKNQQ